MWEPAKYRWGVFFAKPMSTMLGYTVMISIQRAWHELGTQTVIKESRHLDTAKWEEATSEWLHRDTNN